MKGPRSCNRPGSTAAISEGLRDCTTYRFRLPLSAALVQSRLQAGMETSVEPVLRQRFCRATHCGALFWICRYCDRGQEYCSDRCRGKARREQKRAANRRHQQSREGKLDHRDRQRAYRRRRAQVRVTDHGSQTTLPDRNIPLPTFTSPMPNEGSDGLIERNRPNHDSGVPFCIMCGRAGRFVNPFGALRGT